VESRVLLDATLTGRSTLPSLQERAPGLTAVLRATLLCLPSGMPVSSEVRSCDLPVGSAVAEGRTRLYRPGRIRLLSEVALSVVLDGTTPTPRDPTHDPQGGERDARAILHGMRAMLMQRILQSDQLSAVWEGPQHDADLPFQPRDELLWVFCSVATRVRHRRAPLFSKDTASAVEWCNISLVLLDFFAGSVCAPGRRSLSPFADAGRAAYNGLFAAMLQRGGSSPPSTLALSAHMLSRVGGTAPVDRSSPVVGGPGWQLPHVADALSKVGTNLMYLWDKAKHAAPRRGTAGRRVP
jgi:hypothetical protein